jgi:ribosome biogenesis GTPase
MQCRFPDCRHAGEPGCSVEGLVESGQISARRLASYRQLLRLAADVEKRLKSAGRLGPKGRAGSRFRR